MEEDEEVTLVEKNCRHCGELAAELPDYATDWQCPHCERFQQSVICPTCGSLANASLFRDKSAVPAPAKAKKGK